VVSFSLLLVSWSFFLALGSRTNADDSDFSDDLAKEGSQRPMSLTGISTHQQLSAAQDLQGHGLVYCANYRSDNVVLGEGDHGTVYLASNTRDYRSPPVVMKVAKDTDDDLHGEFHVMQALAKSDKLKGHIPRTYAVCNHDSTAAPRVVMDRVLGSGINAPLTLTSFMAEKWADKTAMKKVAAQVYIIMHTMIHDFAITNIDQTPDANILVDREGNVWFVDFGKACMPYGDNSAVTAPRIEYEARISCRASAQSFAKQADTMVSTILEAFDPKQWDEMGPEATKYARRYLKEAACCYNDPSEPKWVKYYQLRAKVFQEMKLDYDEKKCPAPSHQRCNEVEQWFNR